MWRWQTDERELVVVLPVQGADAARLDDLDMLNQAVRAIAFAERRSTQELASDLAVAGGADTVSVRLTPEGVPSGKAPLTVAQRAVNALHDFVVGSAAALEVKSLVLPPRRPARAEAYASQTLVSTAPGSFVVHLALPLLENAAGTPPESNGPTQEPLLHVPPQPYGRRVIQRMRAVASVAGALAEAVATGDRPLRAFSEPTPNAANATELAALAHLGGADAGRYHLRFSEAPGGASWMPPTKLAISPAQQRVLADASDFLRTRQPRAGVTVSGLVVRLARTGNFGAGEVVVQGETDDSGAQRRFRMQLAEPDYNEAVRAHREGLMVIANGDVEFAGTRATLTRITGFAVMPGMD